ncbi:2OG-Fe(II) oxygenase [Pararobbsia silviterrae]|uniref:Proline hydroxylase n=1 Tax=Pararobbsia silviterrae TaxID=1792498 RepID=A0A494Y7I7_9BURK|nr:2OG-Fe(II) oxygenase [Pararobbsia silviterrae]RKP58661.1 hypothetical protein D7S86_01580 [Pararobbsia silviterrae]
MTPVATLLKSVDANYVAAQLDSEGFAVLSGVLAPDRAKELAAQADVSDSLHSESLSSINRGVGHMLRFGAKLPGPWATWRDSLYRWLVPVANRWNEALNVDCRYPDKFEEFLELNREAGQVQRLSHMNRLGEGDYLALHQDTEGTAKIHTTR